MKRLVLAFLVCGMGAVSFGQFLPTYTKLVVLKGTTTDSVHYVRYDANTPTAATQRAAMVVDAVAFGAKPKVNYFMVVELSYTPQIVANKWTGEGDIWVETMGVVEYGVGRHTTAGLWDPKLVYAYDAGGPLWLGYYAWWAPKAKLRMGDAALDCTNAAGTFSDTKDGVGELVYSAKLVTVKAVGAIPAVSWYEPSITSLTISYTQWMQQLITGSTDQVDVQYGAGKVVFKPDTKLTTMANLKNPTTGVNTGLALVAADIKTQLEKGKYVTALTTFVPELDPYGLYR